MSIKATRSGYKTYYIKDATGAIEKCTTASFYVPDLQQDLLAGRALSKAGYRVILDKDPRISGIFPVTNGDIDSATVLPFLDSEGLFFMKLYRYLIHNSKYGRILVMASTTWSLSDADDP